MKTATLSDLIRRFGEDAKCRVWFHGKRTAEVRELRYLLRGSKVSKVVVLFDKPKVYLVDGDAAVRDGISFVVI